MSGGSVTGGTGDVKPQILTVAGTNAVATTVYSVQQVTLPVAKIGFQKTRAQIVEILKVFWNIGSEDFAANNDNIMWAFLSTNSNRTNAGTSSAATSVQDFDDTRTLAYQKQIKSLTTSGATEGNIWESDLTDSNGNGILVAVDRLDFVYSSVGNTGAISASVKILYRYVNVSIQEYVGIVQSQQ